MITPHTSMFC